MAEWMLEGRPSLDLWPLDVRRFSFHHTTRHFMGTRMVELYAHHYKLAAPGTEKVTARGIRRSPLHDTLAAQRRGVRFARRLGAAQLVRTRRRRAGRSAVVRASRTGSPHVGATRTALCANGVGLIDQTSFAKFEITGPGRARRRAVAVASPTWTRPSAPSLHPAVQRARRHRVRPDHDPHRARQRGTSSPAPRSAPTTWAGSGRTSPDDGSGHRARPHLGCVPSSTCAAR